MNVDRDNFEQMLPRIKEDISNASFVAIDLEMTGIEVPYNRIQRLDTPEERYRKYISVASKYLPIQFGLACFAWSETDSAYQASSYNFYVFPRPGERHGQECVFQCQSSAIEFLCTHKMDWNRLFGSGLSYLSKQGETKLRKGFESEKENGGGLVPNDPDKATVEAIFCDIDQWLASDKISMKTEPLNSYMRRLAYQLLAEKYADRLLIETEYVSANHKPLLISRNTDETREESKKRAERAIESTIGFRLVIDELIKSRKPIVGHNMYLDMCFTYQHFIENTPNVLSEFKEKLHEMFPVVYDTKYISSTHPAVKDNISSTTLGDLYAFFISSNSGAPNIVSCNYSDSDRHLHEAAFDAYATGVCFVNCMANIVEGKDHGDIINSTSLADCSNRIFMMRSDIPYLSLTGYDPAPNRNTSFYVSGFPTEWRNSHLVEAFKPIGDIIINWIDDNSCYVDVKTEEKAETVLEMFTGEEKRDFDVMTYEAHYAILTGNDQAGPSPKRPRTSP